MKPLIGITCNFEYSYRVNSGDITGVVGQDFHDIADDYIKAVRKAGGVPVILPLTTDDEVIQSYVDRCDGILISGGNDVLPFGYCEPLKKCGEIVPDRDQFDITLTKFALKAGKPLFGICRGCQIFNVVLGGSLYQDLPSAGFEVHRLDKLPRNFGTHSVNIDKSTMLYKILGKEQIMVNSFHHQAIKMLAKGTVCGAHSVDGVQESIEKADEKFFLGVQWHPEMMFDNELQQKIFKAFVDSAAK